MAYLRISLPSWSLVYVLLVDCCLSLLPVTATGLVLNFVSQRWVSEACHCEKKHVTFTHTST